MEMIVAYLVGVVAVNGLWALRVPHEDVRLVFLLAVAWPLTIVAVLGMVILSVTGWDIDTAPGVKMFGFRKPTNPEVRGFAITAFTVEFQFYSKTRKNSQKNG